MKSNTYLEVVHSGCLFSHHLGHVIDETQAESIFDVDLVLGGKLHAVGVVVG